jgi:hypothetical protein
MPPKSPDDGKEACKTYVEQTKLLVTLASGFILAPPALLSIIGANDPMLAFSVADTGRFVATESLFVLSVLMGYLTLGSISGSQDEGEYDVYRTATLRLSRLQILFYLIGLGVFAWLVLARFSTPAKEVAYPSRSPYSSFQAVEHVPFFFSELASGDQNPNKGTTLSAQQVSDLDRLLKSLTACVGALPGQDVELDVRGYADSNEFPVNSMEQNRETANRRAANLHKAVRERLGTQSGPSRLLLRDLKEWPTDDPLAMTRERYFETLPLNKTGKERDQGLFNRRADLLVLRLGACERMRANQESTENG